MKNIIQIISTLFIAPIIPAKAANPTFEIQTFDSKRGFTSPIAINIPKRQQTRFSLIIDPKIFLSHYLKDHSLPNNNLRGCSITLKPTDPNNLKALTINFGNITEKTENTKLQFTIPNADLTKYQLVFQCYINHPNYPSVGGARYITTLQNLKEKAPITENHPSLKKNPTEK